MTRALIAALIASLVTACGIDGEPIPPKGGVEVSGDIRIGVVAEL